jgi:fibronectin type 3 domain-containing protein
MKTILLKTILRFLLICLLFISFSGLAFGAKAAPSLIFETKNTEQGVKLRWMVTDRTFDYTYVLWRAPGGHLDQKKQIAQFQRLDFKQAKTALKDNKAGLKLMFPFETAKDRNELNQSLAQNDNRLSMLMYLSVREPEIAKALGQYYEDMPPVDMKYVVYTLEVYRGKEVVFTQERGVDLTRQPEMPLLWELKAHRFDWGVGLKWQGYEAYTMFNVYRSDTHEGTFEKINSAPVQVQASRNANGTMNVAPYFYSDTTLKQGQRAFYKVRGVDFFADDGPFTQPVMGKIKVDPHPAVLLRPTVEAKETFIDINWQPSSDKDILGYNIYRSQKYEGADTKLNEHLVQGTFFRDISVQVDLNYFYSVTAVNRGGYESLRSLNALGLAKDVTPPPVVQGLVGEAEKATIKLHWDGVTAKDLLGYRIYRTLRPDNIDWALINNEMVADPFHDDVLTKNLSRYPYYYRITAVDTHYNESAPSGVVKVQLPDVTPPRAPGFTGSSVRGGNVSLTWNDVDVYDLAGYHIYRSVAGKRLKITSELVGLSSFVDASSPVAASVVYEVTAVDKSGNESTPSNPLNLQVRDHQAPTIAHFTAAMDKKTVMLTMISKDKDLAGFNVFRSRNNRDFIRINRDRVRDSTYIDVHVQKGKLYFYRVVVWDQSANKTQSVSRALKVP